MLLAIETATDVCGVALHDGTSVLAADEVLEPRRHAERLVPLIGDVLDAAGLRPADLAVVAVSAGPGSYTGLRIGVSTAKGICLASGARLVAVPTLEALASTAVDELDQGEVVVAALASRRGEVYVAAFVRENGGLRELRPPAALPLDGAGEWLPEAETTLSIVGPAGALLTEHMAVPHRVLDPNVFRPTAGVVASLGAARLAAGTVEDVSAFEPFYLKPFEAKRGASILD